MLQIIPLPRVAVKLDASRCGAQNAREEIASLAQMNAAELRADDEV